MQYLFKFVVMNLLWDQVMVQCPITFATLHPVLFLLVYVQWPTAISELAGSAAAVRLPRPALHSVLVDALAPGRLSHHHARLQLLHSFPAFTRALGCVCDTWRTRGLRWNVNLQTKVFTELWFGYHFCLFRYLYIYRKCIDEACFELCSICLLASDSYFS